MTVNKLNPFSKQLQATRLYVTDSLNKVNMSVKYQYLSLSTPVNNTRVITQDIPVGLTINRLIPCSVKSVY